MERACAPPVERGYSAGRAGPAVVPHPAFRDDPSVEFRLLGPLEVRVGDGRVPLQAPKLRTLLAILLLHANEPVARDVLIEELWAERPPATAAKILKTYVSQLRHSLGRDVIVTAPSAYALRADPASIDVRRFEQLIAAARSAPAPVAAETFREALDLWRGPPLADFAYEPWARFEINRLEGLRLEALEGRIDAELGLGESSGLVAELEQLVAEHPLRERLRGRLMLALYRSGRQADALAVYRDGEVRARRGTRDRARGRAASARARDPRTGPGSRRPPARVGRRPRHSGVPRSCAPARPRSSAASASCVTFERSADGQMSDSSP